MTTTTTKSTPKGTDWNALTPEDWATGYKAVGEKHGVSRSAAAAAHKRILTRGNNPPTNGRPLLAKPEHLDTTLPVAELAKLHNVSTGTVYKWLKEEGK